MNENLGICCHILTTEPHLSTSKGVVVRIDTGKKTVGEMDDLYTYFSSKNFPQEVGFDKVGSGEV